MLAIKLGDITWTLQVQICPIREASLLCKDHAHTFSACRVRSFVRDMTPCFANRNDRRENGQNQQCTRRKPEHRNGIENKSCISRPLIHGCDSRLKSCTVRTELRSILWRRFQRACQPHVVLHRASVSRYSLRPTNRPHQVPQWSRGLPKIGDYLHCSSLLLIV